jgi:hypothetical protein
MCNTCEHTWKDEEIIKGVASEETTINEDGGKQARLEYRFDLIDAKALFELASVLYTGEEKYGKDNWRKIDTESHLNHAISHAYAFLAGDRQSNHLAHALCRCLMALAVELQGSDWEENKC